MIPRIQIYAIISLFLFQTRANAGLDQFTTLDKYQDWIIERKINSSDTSIECRASIPNYYMWFGGRIHLDKEGELVIPNKVEITKVPKIKSILKARELVRKCHQGLIYEPN